MAARISTYAAADATPYRSSRVVGRFCALVTRRVSYSLIRGFCPSGFRLAMYSVQWLFVGVCFASFHEADIFFADSCECVPLFFFFSVWCFYIVSFLPEKGSLYRQSATSFGIAGIAPRFFTRTFTSQCNVQIHCSGRNGEFDSGVYFFYRLEEDWTVYRYFRVFESVFLALHFPGLRSGL